MSPNAAGSACAWRAFWDNLGGSRLIFTEREQSLCFVLILQIAREGHSQPGHVSKLKREHILGEECPVICDNF